MDGDREDSGPGDQASVAGRRGGGDASASQEEIGTLSVADHVLLMMHSLSSLAVDRHGARRQRPPPARTWTRPGWPSTRSGRSSGCSRAGGRPRRSRLTARRCPSCRWPTWCWRRQSGGPRRPTRRDGGASELRDTLCHWRPQGRRTPGPAGADVSRRRSMSVQIGIIGGSGLYDMAELTDREEVRLSTPFGDPSGPYVLATLRGHRVAFLARHGAGHRIPPSELNFRANIFGFKLLGVERIFSASAVGSLKEEYPPLDVVVPDQFFDRTQGRDQHLLRRAGHRRRTCRSLTRSARNSSRDRVRVGAGGGRERPHGRHLRVHGGAAVLHGGRIAALPQLGDGRHRDDQPSGGQAGPRGRDLLHDHRAGHRLRLLASRPRQRDRGHDRREPARATPRWRSSSSRRPSERVPAERGCSCGSALATAIITSPDAISDEDQAGPGAHHRQVREVGAWLTHGGNPILAVGSVAFDTIKNPFGEATRVVGGSATYFSLAASFFTDVRLVAVVGEDFADRGAEVFGGRSDRSRRAADGARARPSAGRASTASISTSARPSTPS